MLHLVHLLLQLKHLLAELLLDVVSDVELRLEHHDLILQFRVLSLEVVLLGLLMLEFLLHLTQLLVDLAFLLVTLHEH